MSIRIDRESGAIAGAGFVIAPGLKRGALKAVQPEAFRASDGCAIRVAEDAYGDHILNVYARDREGGIETYELIFYNTGDSWENWTVAKEESYRRAYHAILAASGIGDKEALGWGHAEIVYDPKNLTYSLWVVHKPQHGASAP